MCGRYVLKTTVKELAEVYSAIPQGELGFRPVYNVAPTLEMPVVLQQNGDRVIEIYRWGLVPHWSKGPDSRYSMINARSETLPEKPAFREAYKKRRCVVPASGFYEWKKTSEGKVPFYIYPVYSDIFSFAGLYDHWEGKDGQIIDSFTIITTGTNQTIKPLHDRMPVILFEDEIDTWINSEYQDPTVFEDMLNPAPDDSLTFYQVSKKVNNARNQDSSLIKQVE